MQTRRAYLTALGTAAVAAVAGCSGDGGESQLPAPTMGQSNASVVVKSWEDFRCPHCRRFHLEVLPKLEREYVSSGEVRFERHDFPLPIDRFSWDTAVAARSVQAQSGEEAYWTFAERAYERQSELSLPTMRRIGSEAGADPARVEADVENGTYRPTVQADRETGSDKGVNSTPTVFVDGKSVTNRYGDIKSAIEEAL